MKQKNSSVGDLEDGKGNGGDDKAGNKKDDSPLNKMSKLIFCFIGLQISYVMWGVVQEHIMTHEYKMGKFKSSAFLVFANRFLALIISLLIYAWQRVFQNKQLKDVPFYYYAPSSLSNTISSWAQYEALKYVSFPTQVLSKSCKIIPVMLVSGF
jgi:solute carrier family 35 (adenosine 3'-phospho 5'-phosphosulfate transporter), member B2